MKDDGKTVNIGFGGCGLLIALALLVCFDKITLWTAFLILGGCIGAALILGFILVLIALWLEK